MSEFLTPEPAAPLETGSRPTFSVLIPAYQAAGTIGEAVESALDQTEQPAEIIVCDDGSTDDLHRALAPFRDRITVLRKENGGGASALNIAAKAARSDFVVILDSDDAYLPERIEQLGALAFTRPDLDVVASDAFFEVGGRVTGRFNEANPFPTANQRRELLATCYLFAPAVRRELLREIGWFDETLRIAYDWDCWIRLLLAGAAVGFVNRPLMRYRLHEGSLSANRVASLEERVTVLKRVRAREALLTSDERAALERSLTYHSWRARHAAAEAALREGDAFRRRRSLRLAVSRGVPARLRLKSVAAALAPGMARRRLGDASAASVELRSPSQPGNVEEG